MRSGKSKVAIDWASVLAASGKISRVLIVTHSPTTFGVWRSEIRKHCPLDFRVGLDSDDVKFSVKALNFWIVNIQSVYAREMYEDRSWDAIPRKDIYDWRPDALVVDEATVVGDPTALQTIMLYRLQKDLGIRYKLQLTGTPVHRKKQGAFGQFKILNEDVFGTDLGIYKAQFCVYGGYLDKTLLRYRNTKRWRKKVEPWVFHLKRNPIRPPVEQIIPVDLTPRTWGKYYDMEKEAIYELDNGDTVLAPIMLTRLLKCAQIAAGWIRDEEGEWHRVGTELRDSFADHVLRLRESGVRKLVVYCRHLPELRDATVALRDAGYKTLLLHGGVHHEQRELKIDRFHSSNHFTAFVSQISTGSMGIDLSAADTTIYYTLTESLLHKEQADARIRTHADKRALTYYYFLPQGTVLETMYLALKDKRDLVDFVMNHKAIIHHEETA
jgi:hypothetical protein